MNEDFNNNYLPETKGEEGSKTVSTNRVFKEHSRPSSSRRSFDIVRTPSSRLKSTLPPSVRVSNLPMRPPWRSQSIIVV